MKSFNSLSTERKGEIIILSEGWLWGLFPVITAMTYLSLPPLVSLGFATLFSSLVFLFLFIWNKRWPELKDGEALKDIFLVALINGALYYILYFIGLKYSTSGNVSLVALMEIFFSYLYFQVWQKEYFSVKYLWGSLLMLLGAVIILLPKSSGWYAGDLLILAAAATGPAGNYFQKRARKKVSTETILLLRCIVSVPAIFLTANLFGEVLAWTDIKNSLPTLLLNGVVLLGLSKIFWIEGIHRLSITKAIALSSVSPLFTLVFAYFLLGNIPTVWQLSSFVPLFFGLILLTSKNPEKELSLEP